MLGNTQSRSEAGFSLAEMLVSLLILLPIMGAVSVIFSVAVNQHQSEQSAVEANQEARAGFELMTLEIAQAGSHSDQVTSAPGTITGNSNIQTVSVASSAGLSVGDYVDVDTGNLHETVQLTAVGTNSISGLFKATHSTVGGTPIRLFALPYITGVISPAGLGANSSASVTTLKFFGAMNGFLGDENGNGNLYYVEYTYDSANNRITRSSTPVPQASKNPAVALVRNVKSGSVQFTLYTDNHAVVTAVSLALVVRVPYKTGSQYQETELSSRIVIPSALAGSALYSEAIQYGGLNNLPPTPSKITTWSSQ